MLFGESENAVALTARAALLTPLRVVGLRPVQPAAGLTTGGTVLSAAPTFQFDRCSTAKRMTEPLIGFALVSNSIYSRSILQCTKGSSLMEMQLEQQRQRAALDSRDAISREAAALARRKAGPSAQLVVFDRLPRLLPPSKIPFLRASRRHWGRPWRWRRRRRRRKLRRRGRRWRGRRCLKLREVRTLSCFYNASIRRHWWRRSRRLRRVDTHVAFSPMSRMECERAERQGRMRGKGDDGARRKEIAGQVFTAAMHRRRQRRRSRLSWEVKASILIVARDEAFTWATVSQHDFMLAMDAVIWTADTPCCSPSLTRPSTVLRTIESTTSALSRCI